MLLLYAAETMLGYFGFDSTIYRDSIRRKIQSSGMSLERGTSKRKT